MSRFWPHSEYAEDQAFSKSILGTHVLMRGFTSGALVGTAFSSARYLRSTPAQRALLPYHLSVIRGAGVGGIYGTGFLAVMLAGRMWGREVIEWQDRSWRLLENRGQVEVDTWSGFGAVTGLIVVLRDPTLRGLGWRAVSGGLGLGTLAGTAGYMVYRHGVKGGKWED